jgi:AdoMet-dependent rRNA methyltransferase SPB1
LDPRHVFKELASSADTIAGNDVQANVFHPEKKRRQRDGYNDGDYTLHKTTSATAFIQGEDPIAVLGTFNKITFETEQEKE